jgi:hypothetical protein
VGQLYKPSTNKYHRVNHNPPQCGCEVGKDKQPFGHTRPRQVDRKLGLTEYQREQRALRRAADAARSSVPA